MEMISTQLQYFLASFLYGIFLFFLYDWLRIFRKIVPHARVADAIEDILFWLAASIFVFQMIFNKNNGILRVFFIVAFGAGMYAYRILAEDRFVEIMEKAIRWLMRPFQWAGKKMTQISKKILEKLKKISYNKDKSSTAIENTVVEQMFEKGNEADEK